MATIAKNTRTARTARTARTSTAKAAADNGTIITLKGRGKAQREQAYLKIAPLSFVENMSRAETIGNMCVALGGKPNAAELAAAQQEWIIGRVASRLAPGDFPKDVTDNADRLEHARKLVTQYAAPAKEGAKARKLRAGQLGRRTESQHKVIRAAEQAWSMVKAELAERISIDGPTAQTQKQADQKKKAKRSTNANPVRGAGKADAPGKGSVPTHDELVKPSGPVTADDATNHVISQAAALLAYANKHAKVLPTDFGMAVQQFKSAINKAANDYQLRKDEADAKRAEQEK